MLVELNRMRTRFGEQGSSSMMLVLVVAGVLMLLGTVALYSSQNNVRSTGQYKNAVQSYYIAEAGLSAARAQLQGMDEADVAGLLDSDNTQPMFDNVPYAGGAYTVTLEPATGFENCGGEVSTDPAFELDGDGAVKTTREVDVTFKALGSEITYGAGGPEIQVYAWVSFNNGTTWEELYDGADVDGGEEQTFEDISPDVNIKLKAKAYYKKGNRVYYNKTKQSDDRSGYIYLLADGDEPPDYEPFGNQESLESYLQTILGRDGTISIGRNDVVMLAELGGSLNSSSSDFQDLVILMEFTETVTVTDPPSPPSADGECTGTFLKVTSTATTNSGASSVLEAIMVKSGGSSGTSAAVANPLAAVMTCGKTKTTGNLRVDGRDHTIDGNLIGSGIRGLLSLNKYTRKGSSRIGGTSTGGVNYSPTKNNPGLGQVSEGYSGAFSAPDGPDEVVGLADGTLKAVAQRGDNGSQYVTDPSDLSFPLSGVTYVELPDGDVWNPVHFGESSGILVVHNSDCNAVIKNMNSGTFAGVIVADDVVHVHCDVLGWMVVLTTASSSGNCIGNGNGTIKYSSAAVEEALATTESPAEEAGLRLVAMIEKN